jgi:hypothetical protein
MLQWIERDEQGASFLYVQSKLAIDHAVLAATAQWNTAQLVDGTIDVDESLAKQTFMHYLSANLKLDDQLKPVIGSSIKETVSIEDFFVVHASETFPYTIHAANGDSVTFQYPGIYVVCKISYQKQSRLFPNVAWRIQGAGQVVPLFSH